MKNYTSQWMAYCVDVEECRWKSLNFMFVLNANWCTTGGKSAERGSNS